MSLRRSLCLAASGVLGALAVTLGAGPTYAANTTSAGSIDHVQLAAGGSVQVLFSVPGTGAIDVGSVSAQIGGSAADATAESASTATEITRTTVLAIDTSASMKGARIREAKKAARAYLADVPANVKVGIVTFDHGVHTKLAPTLDRSAATTIVNGLTLAVDTSLYDGVTGAVTATGTTGQRQVLVLSDGRDTTATPLARTIARVRRAGVKIDVVSLQKGDAGNRPLNELATATHGQVINALDPTALSSAFTSEADVLARQVLVTVKVPRSAAAVDADLTINVDAGGTTYSDAAYVRVRKTPYTAPKPPAQLDTTPIPAATSGITVPQPVVFGGVAALGLGLIGVVVGLILRPATPSASRALRDQLLVYGPGNLGTGGTTPAASLSGQAKDVAASVLANNASLEARIAARLEGAGMSLKPAEWLLVHAGIAIGAGLAGFLLGRGNPLLLLIFLAAGAIGPWFYLGLKKSRRFKAFDSGLADTLQLMSGSLSAGLSLAQSIDTIVREGSEPIASEFKRTMIEGRLGVSLEDALEGVAQRMESRDFEWVVMAIRIQRDVGGNLAELLLTVAGTLREREFLRRHVRALSAEGRLSCYVLGGLPPGFLAYLTLTKPTYVHPMYSTPIGFVLLGGMAVLLGAGIFWMSKVSKVDI